MKLDDAKFKVGDPVIVKPNTRDPDLGTDIGGWQGRISEVEETHNLVCIAWDSLTLKNMPDSVIIECEKEGLDWRQMYLAFTDVESTTSRDTEDDIDRMADALETKHAWVHMGKEGEYIQDVLADVDSNSDRVVLKTWETHLRKNLRFPFAAKVAEYQERGPFRTGDKITALDITYTDELYGIFVAVKHKRGLYDIPLCDLEATDQVSKNYKTLRAYVVWFANH